MKGFRSLVRSGTLSREEGKKQADLEKKEREKEEKREKKERKEAEKLERKKSQDKGDSSVNALLLASSGEIETGKHKRLLSRGKEKRRSLGFLTQTSPRGSKDSIIADPSMQSDLEHVKAEMASGDNVSSTSPRNKTNELSSSLNKSQERSKEKEKESENKKAEKENGEETIKITKVADISKKKTFSAIDDYQALDGRELSFKKGDLLIILDADESGWCEGAVLTVVLPSPRSIVSTESTATNPTVVYQYGKVGWFPATCILSTEETTEEEVPKEVETISIVKRRKNTMDKLDSFFMHTRPSEQELRNRNILLQNAGVSPQVAVAQKELMTKNKQTVLGQFLKSFNVSGGLKPRQRGKTSAVAASASAFGIDFKEILKQEGHTCPIPFLFYQCAEYLKEHSLETEGLFRISAAATEVESLRKQFKTGMETIDLSKFDVHCITNIMKAFLRELPDSLIVWDVAEPIKKHMTLHDPKERNKLINAETEKLDQENRVFLDYLFDFLHKVTERSEVNKMNSSNLAIVFTPSLIVPKVMSVENLTNQALVQLIVTFIEAGTLHLSVGETEN